MKTTRKWLALVLAAVLALSLSATALAAETVLYPADIAAEFLAMLDQDGIEYADLGYDSDEDYEIIIYYPGDYREEHEITLYIDSDGTAFSAFEWYLMEYDETRLNEVLEVINELNNAYRFVTFLADTSDNTITAETHGVLRGDAGLAARTLHYAYDYLPLIVDDVWTRLTEELPAVGTVEAADDYAGTWKFSSMTFTEENNGVPAGTELTAEDFGNAEIFVLELKENGEMHLTSFGIETDGTWVRDGAAVVLSDETGDFFAELLDRDTLHLDASEDGGYIMTLTREE